MLPLPSTNNASCRLKPNEAGVESLGGRGLWGPGDGQGRRGAERGGLGKQKGLTHTHPRGWDWTQEGFAGCVDVPGTVWQWGEAAIPLELHCGLTQRKTYVSHVTLPADRTMLTFLFPYLHYCIPPAGGVPALAAPVAPEALCVSGCALAGHLSVE